MKILFIVDKYYPESSANTVCSEKIIKYLQEQGNQVDVLTELVCNDGNDLYSYNGSKVIKFKTYHNKMLRCFGKLFKAKNWEDFPKLFKFGAGTLYRLTHPTRINTQYNSFDLVNYNKIAKQIKNVGGSYDIIMSVSSPFALQVLAVNLIKRGVAKKWFPIFLDPFVYNKVLKKSKIDYRKKVAENVLSVADTIFVIEGVMAENKRQGYNPEYHNKIIEITIPNLKKDDNNHIALNQKSDKIVLTYAGLFYKDIRNPQIMFEIIKELPASYELHIYGEGCNDLINQYVNYDNQKFKYFGRVEHSVCLNKLFNSNILINLSNTITNQMPSKVFEYISYGKPIVNFYFSENDISLKYFKKYPLAFNINLNNYTSEDIENLKAFCEKNKNVCLNFEDATENLVEYRVENICKNMYANILKNMDN